MSYWQPIETAPKDGTPIDVWVEKFSVGPGLKIIRLGGARVPNAFWGRSVYISVNPYSRDEGEEDGWVHQADLMNHEPIEYSSTRVTHWMPIPGVPT